MSLFQPSTKAVSAACQEIADCVGASGDSEMTTRGLRSLRAMFQHFNNHRGIKWNFLRAEAAPVTVFAPFAVTGVSASAGQSSAAAPAGHGIQLDDMIAGSGFGAGERVSATAASGFGIYGTVTGFTAGATVVTPTFSRDLYALPSDCKAIYTAALLIARRPLYYIGRRLYDRLDSHYGQASTPAYYDLFVMGAKGKIRLLEVPNASDRIMMRYYRRMTVPTVSATAEALDIPDDYEGYAMAWAKWHFLVDKGEGRGEQAKTWFSFATEGLRTMLAEQTMVPDEALVFVPGHVAGGSWGDSTTRFLDWDFT